MIVLFSSGAREAFAQLAEPVRLRAARNIQLLKKHPYMYPVRRRGVMRGHRYFIALGVLFYYSVASDEVRISAIIPGRMREA